jgi:hypothetical protein
MANSYNSMPILINTDTASGWRSLQTLNTGNLPSVQNQPPLGPVTRQWGLHVFRIIITAQATTLVTGVITVSDPNDNTVLFQTGITNTAAASIGGIIYDSGMIRPAFDWRDFKVTGVTNAVVQMEIWYRA